MQSTSGEHLAWEAFRYVADEMAPAEIAAFEERLDHDQSAREAVAAVVRLSAAMKAAHVARQASGMSERIESATASKPAPAGATFHYAAAASWMALGAAACLAVMTAWQSWHGPGPIAVEGVLPSITLSESRQVAQAWTEVDDEPASESSESGDDEAGDETGTAGDDDAVAADWETPSWLSAGVSDDDQALNTPATEETLP